MVVPRETFGRGASSTDRCNTFCELLSRRLIEQGLSRPFIELPCDGTVRAPVPAPPRTIAFPRSFLVLTETRVFPAMMEELQDGANCAQVHHFDWCARFVRCNILFYDEGVTDLPE